ncbi:phosphoribosylanthranilate isomerase [Haloglomus salinum]|jgi:phosphoribosylanthranilate isomerase|uniref:phosphoribosylanthranilate isomerase n=1 Tax=Haloglomus salinum TaxID=2962673 RepID=UPI0020C9B35F|nr:phosphoribosylanthranilate isomerase [Haloglomus salinum]
MDGDASGVTAAARPRTKVCGVTREVDLRTVVDAGTDAVGVITDVTVDTPREVSVEQARDLLDAVPPFVTGTLVTMPANAEAAVRLVERLEPDAVQVHGLAPDRVAALRVRAPVPVLAAVDAVDAPRYAGAADALVVDSLDEAGGGGTGETHDWERTRGLVAELDTPVVLAGGLTPENVADAVRTVRPFAVDVASGVEREGGVKDADAVRAFVRNATQAPDEEGVTT